MRIVNISRAPLDPPATPPVWAQIKPQVLAYLQQAPAIMVARTKHPDALDPSKTFVVPVSIRTDGTFTWPTGVNYYAEHHDITLLDHMRALEFQVPTITDQMQQDAINSLQRHRPRLARPASGSDGLRRPAIRNPSHPPSTTIQEKNPTKWLWNRILAHESHSLFILAFATPQAKVLEFG